MAAGVCGLLVVVEVTLGKRKNAVWHEFETKRHVEERQRDYTRHTFYLADFAKEMRLINIYKVMLERFRTSVQNIISYTHKYGWKAAALDYIINECMEVLSCMGDILYAVYQTLVTGNMGYGDCLVVINSIESLIYIVANTGDAFMAFHQNSLYIDTIREYLDYEPKVIGGDKQVPDLDEIRFENVSFAYDGAESEFLTNVDLSLRRGEKIAIVGYNGAGKSTFIKLLLHLYNPTSGRITWNGINLQEFSKESYRNTAVAVFQDYQIFAASLAENVLADKYREELEYITTDALRDATFSERLADMENGIHTPLTREFSENGVNLSGGESQKVAIARAFAQSRMQNSEVIIMDEPSSALDPMAEYELNRTILEYTGDKTVIFISHRLSTTRMADRIFMFDNGRLIETGSHEELMELDGKYAEMFRMQAEKYRL